MLILLLFLYFTAVNAIELDKACQGKGPHSIRVIKGGNLYSPGFKENKPYPPNLSCEYQLHAPSNMFVKLKFNNLDIEPLNDCKKDSLTVIDFPNSIPTVSKIYCGRNLPEDYVSSFWVLQLNFRTDSDGNGRGFNITYSAVPKSKVCSEEGQEKCRNRKCYTVSQNCNGKDDCGDGSDEEECRKPVIEGICGKPDIDPLTFADYDRIVGGKTARPHSWPWMVEIQAAHIEPSHICGGTLINSQWVLTAAHCFGSYKRAKDIRIHLGKHRKYDKDSHEFIRYAKNLIIYNDIDPEIFGENGKFDLDHDIALIQLNAPVPFSRYVKPACLPDKNLKLSSRNKCYATGWGDHKGIGSGEELKQTYHPIHSDETCRRIEYKPETMICAGSMDADDGICAGDSGGPLICKIDDEWTVAGVSSYIQGDCGLEYAPSVFNKVSAKIDYIQNMILKYSR